MPARLGSRSVFEVEQHCPMGPHTFTGSYQDHLAGDERHKIARPAPRQTLRTCLECAAKDQQIRHLQAELEQLLRPVTEPNGETEKAK
jgi:hypothetical protein